MSAPAPAADPAPSTRPLNKTPKPLYGALPRGRRAVDGLSEEDVAADQRRRLYGAMIELVAERGYAGVSTRALARLARMSKQDMYRHFPGKQSYFLATYDMIVARASERVAAAYAVGGDWQQRLRAAFKALAAEVAEEPKAARLGLSEVLGAGPAGVERMERTRGLFEAMVGASFAQAPGGRPLPPLIVKGIVRGVERIIRQRLLSGRAQELPGLADELMAWALSYHSSALAELSRPPAPSHRIAGSLRAKSADERILVLRAAAHLAAVRGWEQLTPSMIAQRVELPAERVLEHWGGSPQQCFLDALELLSLEALVCGAAAARGAKDRPTGVHRAVTALMERVARDRVLCRIAFVEIFALGPCAIERREALLATFTDRLSRSLPADRRPSPLIVEAIVGALWGTLHHHATRGEAHLLPGLADQTTYLALAPALGAQDAISAIVADRYREPIHAQAG